MAYLKAATLILALALAACGGGNEEDRARSTNLEACQPGRPGSCPTVERAPICRKTPNSPGCTP